MWAVMGDYVKAFPHVWRTDLLTLMSKVLRAQPGCMLLLEECLKEDLIVVFPEWGALHGRCAGWAA